MSISDIIKNAKIYALSLYELFEDKVCKRSRLNYAKHEYVSKGRHISRGRIRRDRYVQRLKVARSHC